MSLLSLSLILYQFVSTWFVLKCSVDYREIELLILYTWSLLYWCNYWKKIGYKMLFKLSNYYLLNQSQKYAAREYTLVTNILQLKIKPRRVAIFLSWSRPLKYSEWVSPNYTWIQLVHIKSLEVTCSNVSIISRSGSESWP